MTGAGSRSSARSTSRTFRVPADDTEVEPGAGRRGGLEGDHGVGAVEDDDDPAGPVVGPFGVDDVGAIDAENCRDLVHERIVNRTAAQQRRSRECEHPVRAPDPYQADAALLDDDIIVSRHTA